MAINAVGAATSPAAGIPLRAIFKKPLREMSCIASPTCRPTFVEPFGGSVGFLESNVSRGACGTERYSPPPRDPDVPVKDFLTKFQEGVSPYGTMSMRTVSVTCAPPDAEPAMITTGSPALAVPDCLSRVTATSHSSSMSWAGET